MFNLGMNQNAQAVQQNQGQSNRFYPASQSLNKNAEGFVVSINMTQQDITKSRFESRLEWFKNGRPQAAPRQMGQSSNSFGQQQPGQTGQFMVGGVGQVGSQNKFVQQTPQGSLFPSQTPGGLFQQPMQPLGGPQANPLQPPMFSLGGTSQNPQVGLTQQQPTSLFGGLGGVQQPSSIFGSTAPQQQQTGMFGQQPGQFGSFGGGLIGQQQQLQAPASNLLGGINMSPLTGQQTLFTPQQTIQQPSQMTYPQQLEMYHQLQQSLRQQDLLIELQIESDTRESDYIKDLEEQLRNSVPPISYGTESYSINIAKSNQVQIKITGARKSRPSNLISTQSSVLSSQSRNQQFVRKSSTTSVLQQQKDQRQISFLSTKSRAQNKKSFYMSCQNLKLRKLLTFDELGMDESKLNQYNVEELIQAIKSKILKDEDQQYSATYSQLSSNEPLQVLSNDIPLDTIQLNQNTTISLIPHKTSQIRLNQEFDKKINPNRPILNGDWLIIKPSIKELKYMTDQQLQYVENFEVCHEQFGKVLFLQPVDLRRVEIDRVIIFAQDEICFYPEDEFQTPQPGTGLNVKCLITFFKFGSGQPEMMDLKNNDFEAFIEKVKEWANGLDMQIIELNQDILQVQVLGV